MGYNVEDISPERNRYETVWNMAGNDFYRERGISRACGDTGGVGGGSRDRRVAIIVQVFGVEGIGRVFVAA